MAVYVRETCVRAPLSAVWDFHSSIDGLLALTPRFLGLRVESTTGPDGEPDPDTLEPGATVVLSMGPFGVGPRVRWTSRIVDRRRDGGRAWFRDEMIDGPLRRWIHDHRFREADGGTVVRDRVTYEVGGPLGRPGALLVGLGLAATFAARHRRTRQLLEGRGRAATT